MQAAIAAVVLMLTAVVPSAAFAAPKIPSSELPGRERDRFLDKPYPPVPRIELLDGRPKPVITEPKRPPKRKCRVRGSKRC